MADRNEYMKAAVDEMEKINAEKEKRYRYLMREKREHDEATIRFFERESGIKQGIEQGIEQGIILGTSEAILELLEESGEVPELLRKTISEQHDLNILKRWHKFAARAGSIEEFEHMIENG